jgi:hypothetical protein
VESTYGREYVVYPCGFLCNDMDVDDNNMIYLHDPHTEYTEEQLREMCWEGNCDSDCKYCKVCCRNGCEKCEE